MDEKTSYTKQLTSGLKKDCFLHRKRYLGQKFTGEVCGETAPVTALEKKSGKDFIILNFTDNHFSDYDIRLPLGLAAAHTMRRLVKKIKPDLITVTGDIVCAKSSYMSIRYFTDMMEEFGVPWAPVFGNHEDETNCDKNYLADIMRKGPRCLMQKGPSAMGVGNYIIKINDESGKTVETLFMLDSGHSQPGDAQVQWMIDSARGEDSGEKAVFMHIPLPEYQTAYDSAWDYDSRRWKDGFGAFGEQNERICCERDTEGNPVFRGFVDRISAEIPGVKHIICGHEHTNDWSVVYGGIRYTYTLKVGKGSGFRPGMNGGTVIRVSDSGISSIEHFSSGLTGWKITGEK